MPTEFWWKITAITFIAVGLIATLVWELRRPKQDPNDNPDTKRMNDMLKD
ncbi:hypothetical protein [Hydrogenimonas cancrithermarum]|uniref:Cbb3-type cytochrome c oxidase subunit 3 n=1 Tax=Hydrogenimonas cancrithermarum TaxID=2993563 RepID=A0ABM8FJ00_9BACT|nr:hypothetical protein [Hydrogenimonas cancrithermarum]BDY12260.1 hypothetical protein HCR_05720 [Hydrogenimonas cancrithermarum]